MNSLQKFLRLFFFINGDYRFVTDGVKFHHETYFFSDILMPKKYLNTNEEVQEGTKWLKSCFFNWKILAYIFQDFFSNKIEQDVIDKFAMFVGKKVLSNDVKPFIDIYESLFSILEKKFEHKVIVHFMDKNSSQTLTETFSVCSVKEFQFRFDMFIEALPYTKWYSELEPTNELPDHLKCIEDSFQ